MKLTVERVEDLFAPGVAGWVVSDDKFKLILEMPNHAFHLDRVLEKFEIEKNR